LNKIEFNDNRRAKKLKIIGIIVLVLGISGAGIVYWLGTRSDGLSDDISMLGYDKPRNLQMERMYGKWGDLTNDVLDDLKQPGTQAFIIVATAGLVAWGCFYVAGRINIDDAG
jgi:hypothetical protein